MMLPVSKSLLYLSLLISTCRAPIIEESPDIEKAPIKVAPDSIPTVPNKYIVQLGEQPLLDCLINSKVDKASDCGNKEKVEKNHLDFKQTLVASEVKFEIHNTMDTVFNGISVSVNSLSDINKIATFPNVKAIWPVVKIFIPKVIHHETKIPETKASQSQLPFPHRLTPPQPQLPFSHRLTPPQPQLPFSHYLTGVTRVYDEMKLTGEGIKVGIIDTGIDYRHPGLGGCFGKKCKVAFGYDFVGKAYNGENTPNPDNNLMDCDGHGTHVAGIVGARDKDFVGVAPDVTLGAYKVYGCEGGTENDIVIKALEMAYNDKMDIINMSFGDRNGWPESPEAVVASKLASEGMIAIASIGNIGELGILQASMPGVGENVIGVASFDNSYYRSRYLKVQDREIPFSEPPSPRAEKGKLAELAYSLENKDGCKGFPDNFFHEKTALIQRGNCGFFEKSKNAQAGGAKSVIIFNNSPDSYLDLHEKREGITIPELGVGMEDGHYLLEKLLSRQSITLEVHDLKPFPIPTSGKISEFSSWGLSPDLKLKPDLGAPGGIIYSTYPTAKGSYETLSGTSMASPYVAGVTALYLQQHKKTNDGKLKFDDLRTVLQNTAIPVTEPGCGKYLTSVARQGAGLVQADRAIHQDFIVTPSSFSLGLKSDATQTFYIKDLAGKDRNFIISHEFSVAANAADLNKPVCERYAAKVKCKQDVFVNAGATGEFKVFITRNSNFKPTDHYVYGGFINVTALDNEDKPTDKFASIPFSGYSGDYLSRPVIEKMGENAPRISLIKENNAVSSSKEKEFHFDMGDILLLEFTLALASRKVDIHLYNSKDGKDLGLIESFPLLSRNVPEDPTLSYEWYGIMDKGRKVKPGSYRIQMRALKSPADPLESSSYDIWDSEPFSVLQTKQKEKPVSNFP